MCHLQNKAMCDYQESVTIGQIDRQTDAEQSDPYVPLCFAGDTKMNSNTIMYSNDVLLYNTVTQLIFVST